MGRLLWLLGVFGWIGVVLSTNNMDPKVEIKETVPDDKGKYIVEGFISQDVTLNCQVNDLPPGLDVKWQRTVLDDAGNKKEQFISTDMDIQDNNKFSIEKPTAFSWRLRIKALEVTDEGNYTCFVQQTLDAKITANRTVLAYDTPVILQSVMSDDKSIGEGEYAELKCNATGRPRPTLIWLREGNAILPNGGVEKLGGTLVITKAKYDDRGTYMCRAVNRVGEVIRKIFLQITFAPKLSGTTEMAQAVGYQRTLVCYVDSNPQPKWDAGSSDLIWTKGNRGMKPDDRIKYRTLVGAYSRIIFELIFTRVTEDDFGEYQCIARNSLGTTQTSFKLTKSDIPLPDKGGRISAAPAPYSPLGVLLSTTLAAIFFISSR